MIKICLTPFLLIVTAFAGYAQDISKGHTFADGDTVHAADLNTLVDSATILRTFISNKATATPLATDNILFDQASTSTLKQASISDLITAGNAITTTDTRSPNTFLGGPSGGLSAAAPTFRALVPADTADATNTNGGTTIDCSVARTFYRTLTANTSFNITNFPDGATITVAVKQAAAGGPFTTGFTVAGTVITWRGGTPPVQTTTANKTDLFTFIHISGGFVFGSASQNY